jgi:hypothetical protein
MQTLTESLNEDNAHKVKSQAGEILDLRAENGKLRERIALLEQIDSIPVHPPKWTLRKPKGSQHRGIVTLMLSDAHWDEVVEPSEIEGVNAYNREIAIKRLKRVIEGTVLVTRQYYAGLKYEGLVLMLGGDLLSGNIHEELVETNEDTVIGSIDFWVDQLVAFIGTLADEFGRVHVPCVVGNHGRNTRKPRAKLRVRDNFDWLMYRMASRFFKNDGRVTFDIPESSDCPVKIYDTTFRLSHGDQFRGGSGISGMFAPLMLGHHRKSQRQASLHRPYDWMVIGHWHQYWTGQGLIVNGSVKGYDEYAYVSNFRYERPIQAMWVTTPENGLSFPAPIFCENKPKEEGW